MHKKKIIAQPAIASKLIYDVSENQKNDLTPKLDIKSTNALAVPSLDYIYAHSDQNLTIKT